MECEISVNSDDFFIILWRFSIGTLTWSWSIIQGEASIDDSSKLDPVVTIFTVRQAIFRLHATANSALFTIVDSTKMTRMNRQETIPKQSCLLVHFGKKIWKIPLSKNPAGEGMEISIVNLHGKKLYQWKGHCAKNRASYAECFLDNNQPRSILKSGSYLLTISSKSQLTHQRVIFVL